MRPSSCLLLTGVDCCKARAVASGGADLYLRDDWEIGEEMSLRRRLVRTLFTSLHRLRALWWAAAGPGRAGVHAVPLTAAGRVVLVRLTYAPGWRLPGGGRKRGEAEEAAMLRELREEIGLTGHGAIERLADAHPGSGLPGDRSALFRVRDIVYRPRRSLEIEAVREFDPASLPDDTAGWTRETLEALARRPEG